jgi:glycosyltransferase involved in cell wall biosynthesis
MGDTKLSILALSPYHSGPREAFLDALASRSRHTVNLLTLPPRTWPWRLKGSALHFAREIDRLRRRIDLVLADDLVDVSRLRSLLPPRLRNVPVVQYLQTDVISGDLRGNPRDEPLALAQFYSLLSADQVLVASQYHRTSLLDGARRLMGTFGDAVPVGLIERLEETTRVQPPGVDAAAIRAVAPRPVGSGPPVVLWNHPWIDEQNPRAFFETLDYLAQDGVAFRLIAVGIAVRNYPGVFERARKRLSRHLIQFGYVPGREQYLANIRAAQVVVSTADREWFPLATVEAAIAGAQPLVSRGLANGEVFGDLLPRVSYRGAVDLRRKLARLLTGDATVTAEATALGEALARRYDWSRVAGEFDETFAKAAAGPA